MKQAFGLMLRDRTARWMLGCSLMPLVLFACGGRDQIARNELLSERVRGTWAWVESESGYAQQLVHPPLEGSQYVIEFLPSGTYREYKNGEPVLETSYSVQPEPVFNLGNAEAPVVRMGDTRFFTQFSPDTSFAAEIRGDTLELMGTTSDAWYHRFIPLKE